MKEEYIIQTGSERATLDLGHKLAILLRPGDVITLEGQLGAGKTALTKGIAEGLGVKESVTSPTFTIVKEYHGEIPLYHMDAYRLEHSEEDIGFNEYFEGNGICVVEWAQFIENYLPIKRLEIIIEYVDEHTRKFRILPNSTHFRSVTRSLLS